MASTARRPRYSPSIPEVLLGLGGVAVALIITAVGVRVLQFLPESLADADRAARGCSGTRHRNVAGT